MEETFERDFDCRQLSELPGDGRFHYYYPGATTEGGSDGLIVRVTPRAAASWIGIFAFGEASPKGMSGLYSWPDPGKLCVVSRGQAYLVRVDEPSNYEIINVHPVLKVIPIALRQMVVFANYTELVAYGETGNLWVSDRLSWDGFIVTAVTGDHIEGRAWDPSVEAEVPFRVVLNDGRHVGGGY